MQEQSLTPELLEVKCPYSARNMTIVEAIDLVKEKKRM